MKHNIYYGCRKQELKTKWGSGDTGDSAVGTHWSVAGVVCINNNGSFG